jgi:hypothetical protein
MTQRSAVPEEFRSPPDKITPPQRSYIEGLLEYKDLSDIEPARIDSLMKQLRISYDVEEIGLTKAQATEIITWLKGRRNKTPAQVAQSRTTMVREDRRPDVPAGRYAVDSNEGELRFYQVWRPKDNPNVFRVYVLHGPDSSPVHQNAVRAIMDKIAADVRGAAIRFGNEIGQCSNCGRRLTNRISRELGIGPVCGGRMFDGSDWKSEVKAARTRIEARGEDPDEELE